MENSPTAAPSEQWLDRFCRRLLELRPEDDPNKCLEYVQRIWRNVFLLSPESAAEQAAVIFANRKGDGASN
jgi:hypothetical protein